MRAHVGLAVEGGRVDARRREAERETQEGGTAEMERDQEAKPGLRDDTGNLSLC